MESVCSKIAYLFGSFSFRVNLSFSPKFLEIIVIYALFYVIIVEVIYCC